MAEGLQQASRRAAGGILELLGLIEEHRSAFEYDWRNRFGLALEQVGKAMSWGEAVRLTLRLAADPSSHVGAAVNGMQFPASRDYMAIQRLNANFVARYTQKRARFLDLPDPFVAPPRRYVGTPMDKERLRAVLAAHRALPAREQKATII